MRSPEARSQAAAPAALFLAHSPRTLAVQAGFHAKPIFILKGDIEMKKYRAIATMTTYAEVRIEAQSTQEAYEIADEMDGADFKELAGEGEWTIDILPAE